MEEPVTHRAAVLQYATGQIQLESEAVESIKDSPGETFEAPVAYAVFIFGEAPRRSFDPKDDLAPEKVPAKQIVKDLFAEPQERHINPVYGTSLFPVFKECLNGCYLC